VIDLMWIFEFIRALLSKEWCGFQGANLKNLIYDKHSQIRIDKACRRVGVETFPASKGIAITFSTSRIIISL